MQLLEIKLKVSCLYDICASGICMLVYCIIRHISYDIRKYNDRQNRSINKKKTYSSLFISFLFIHINKHINIVLTYI